MSVKFDDWKKLGLYYKIEILVWLVFLLIPFLIELQLPDYQQILKQIIFAFTGPILVILIKVQIQFSDIQSEFEAFRKDTKIHEHVFDSIKSSDLRLKQILIHFTDLDELMVKYKKTFSIKNPIEHIAVDKLINHYLKKLTVSIL